ncbi:hypothetical protein T06_6853, partial [Trichinella sp. T6]
MSSYWTSRQKLYDEDSEECGAVTAVFWWQEFLLLPR